MITYSEAKSLAFKKLEDYMSYDKSLTLIIQEEDTIHEDFGWIFFYNSKEYLETGDLSYALGGNAPLIVDKKTGQVVETGTALPIEKYIDFYKKGLSIE